MIKAGPVIAFLLCSNAAAAETVQDTVRLGPSTDPAQIVCIRDMRLGSRLDIRKVCRTRAEWREHRRMYRESLERGQNQRMTH